jgi:hypothetical protein
MVLPDHSFGKKPKYVTNYRKQNGIALPIMIDIKKHYGIPHTKINK